MIHIQGDIVLHAGQEKVVVDTSPLDDDHRLDRVVLRPKDDPDGELEAAPPEEVQIVGHLKPGEVPGWREVGPNHWVRDEVD